MKRWNIAMSSIAIICLAFSNLMAVLAAEKWHKLATEEAATIQRQDAAIKELISGCAPERIRRQAASRRRRLHEDHAPGAASASRMPPARQRCEVKAADQRREVDAVGRGLHPEAIFAPAARLRTPPASAAQPICHDSGQGYHDARAVGVVGAGARAVGLGVAETETRGRSSAMKRLGYLIARLLGRKRLRVSAMTQRHETATGS